MDEVEENDHIRLLESFHFQEQHSASNIIPGLINLNLGIVHTLDLHMIEEAKLDVIQSKKDDAHPILQNVQNNIIALLQTKIPRERYIARETLESIIRDDPNHLNALADLEHIYRDLNRIAEANDCKTRIEKILAGTSEKNIESKRISLLEQGYAIRMEKTLINENTIDLKASELQTVISTELKNSSGQRKNCLTKSLRCHKQMLQHLQDGRKHKTLDEHIIRMNSSVHKFETVLALFPDKMLHPVWNFNFAKSLNQYCDLIENMSAIDSKDRRNKITEISVRALNLFWQTTQQHEDEDTLYNARSYAYIGHIITKRKYLFGDKNLNLSIPSFERMLDKPSIIFEKAFSLAPQDVTVLNRYGRSLWNQSESTENNQKIAVLKQADDILTKSIESESKRNWFAFSTRQLVRKYIANAFPEKEVLSQIKYFELAREDGHQCLRFKGTLKDMTILAEVCQNLAKCPVTTKYGPRFVKPEKRKYIIEAIDHLYYGLRLGDSVEYHSTHRMALCLADLGEISKAIEWQKRAWLLSKPETTFPVGILCMFLTLSFEEINRTSDKKITHLLKDLLYVLKRAKDQYSSEKLSKMYTFLYKRRHKYVLQMFLRGINELSPFDSKTKEVMLDYVNHTLGLPNMNRNERKSTEEVVTLLSKAITVENKEDIFLNIFETKSVEPSTNSQSVSLEYEFDFFVCHSHTNGEWVNSILLPHLENAYQDDEIILKGCIADRDFQPGKTILKNIVHAITKSSKIILILSNDFLNSAWCQFEIEQALLDGSRQDRIITVRLEDCEVPCELKNITYIDLTNNENNFDKLQKIKYAIF